MHHFYHGFAHMAHHERSFTSDADLIKILIPTIISVGALVVSYLAYYKAQDKLFTPDNIKRDGFQAVFLTNGQAYFGKITQVDKALVKLEHIYYLQEGIVPEQANEKNLVKLGQELHGPVDIMFIDRSHVIFWENLKSDSPVVKAILEYEGS